MTCPRTRTRLRVRVSANYAPNDGGGGVGDYVPSAGRPDLRVFQRTWEPAGGQPAAAGVLLLHGGSWHGGWFGELARALAGSATPCRVLAFDLLSHGRSDRIDGIQAYATDFQQDFLPDARAALDRLRQGLPEGAPLFVFGESMGGLNAALLAIDGTGVEDVTGWVRRQMMLHFACDM